MANVAWGIDIGNRALKAVKLARGADGVSITDFAFIEHDTILSEAGDNRDALIQTALAKFVGRHETRKIPVAVGVGGQQSFARFVPLPPVEAKKIPDIVKFEAVQQIPFPLDEVEWSYQLFERDDDPDIQVGIFAMRKELINEVVGEFLDVDLDVHAVQTNPLAVYNAVRYEGRLDKGYAVIIDLGADSTDLIIADNDSIWMRSLDLGGNNFTEALAKAFKIDFEKAEEMKRNAKTSKYAKQIYQAMRPVFGELVSEVQRSLGFFQSSHRDVKLRKIIAVGGGFRLNGLSGYLQKNLQMPVEKPQRFQVPAPDDSAAAAALSENTLSGTTAYGLALQLLGETKVTSSLLPTHIRKDKMWRDKTKYFAAAGGLVVLAAGVAFGSYLFKSNAYESREPVRRDIQQIISQAEQLDSQWATVASSGGDKLKQVQNVNQLVQDRYLWGRLLADIYSVLPGPDMDVTKAMAGEFGEPGVPDEADAEVIKQTPRNERLFVQVQKLESVYTDYLAEVVNAENFYTAAEDILAKGDRSRFQSTFSSVAPTPASQPILQDENARGYIMRLTLTTPADEETVYAQFDYDKPLALAERLTQISPQSAEFEGRPYEVIIAGVRRVAPLRDNPEQLAVLSERYAARQAFESGEEGGTDTATAGRTGNNRNRGATGQNRGGGNPYGDPYGDPYGGGLYGDPYGDPYGGGEFGGPGGSPYGGSPYGGGRGTNRRSTGGNVDSENPAYLDPVTGESMLNDTVIEVVFAVVLDPQPPEETEEEDFESGEFGGDEFVDIGS